MASKRELGKHYIREWRQHRGYSLRKLALLMEREPGEELTSHANLQRIETYQQPYTQDILEALATALGVSVSELLTVNPAKDGEVVDLLRLINERDRPAVVRMLRAFTGTEGRPGVLPSDEEPADLDNTGGYSGKEGTRTHR